MARFTINGDQNSDSAIRDLVQFEIKSVYVPKYVVSLRDLPHDSLSRKIGHNSNCICDYASTILSWLPPGNSHPSHRQFPSIHRDRQRDLIWSNSVKQFAPTVNDICISNEGE
jgi:hypothetical protein